MVVIGCTSHRYGRHSGKHLLAPRLECGLKNLCSTDYLVLTRYFGGEGRSDEAKSYTLGL